MKFPNLKFMSAIGKLNDEAFFKLYYDLATYLLVQTKKMDEDELTKSYFLQFCAGREEMVSLMDKPKPPVTETEKLNAVHAQLKDGALHIIYLLRSLETYPKDLVPPGTAYLPTDATEVKDDAVDLSVQPLLRHNHNMDATFVRKHTRQWLNSTDLRGKGNAMRLIFALRTEIEENRELRDAISRLGVYNKFEHLMELADKMQHHTLQIEMEKARAKSIDKKEIRRKDSHSIYLITRMIEINYERTNDTFWWDMANELEMWVKRKVKECAYMAEIKDK